MLTVLKTDFFPKMKTSRKVHIDFYTLLIMHCYAK